MIIDTILSLDTASFATGMGKAVQGVQSFVGIIQGLSGKMQGAFDLGGQLTDVSAQTGESAGNVMILQRAFENAGLGADTMQTSLAKMQKGLAEVDDYGKTSNKTFAQLGLKIEDLKGMNAEQQFSKVAGAIMGLPTASDRAAASMEIFGKSGAKMLSLFADGSSFDVARQQLGGLPALMDRNAVAFDVISDRIGSIKQKSRGFWAGFAEGVLPVADYISELMDGIDLTGIGQAFGRSMMTVIEMVKGEGIGEVLYNGITSAFQRAVDYGLSAFKRLNDFMITDVIAPISAGFTTMFEKVLMPDRARREKNVKEWGSLLNGVTFGIGDLGGKLVNSEMAKIAEMFKQGDPNQYNRSSFEDGVNNAKEFYAGYLSAPAPEIFGKNTAEQQSWDNMWSKYSEIAENKIGAVQKTAKEFKPFGADMTTTPEYDVKETKSIDVKSDALAKVGGFLGGFNIMGGMLQIAKDTLDVQRNILNAVKQPRGGAVFA